MSQTATLAERYIEACKRENYGLIARLGDELEAERATELARLDSPNALLNTAVWYARRGVAVFPCEPCGKKPITRHGLKDATTDVDTVAAWWRRTPDANIGAPTGITFDVIDIDGREGIYATYGAGVEFPPEIGHSITTRDAGHHIFIRPSGRGNGASIFPGVDYRGVGGYVILPPSRGANGRRYTWTRPLQIDGAA
jgi:hypothetical protein